MAALARLIWVAMVLLVPGGLVLLFTYLLARALLHTWQHEQTSEGLTKVRRVVSSVRLRDIVREARAAI